MSALKRARSGLNSWVAAKHTVPAGGSVEVLAELAETVQQAGEKLRNLLLELHVGGNLSAEKLCEIAYWHQASGGCGLEAYSTVRPGGNSGNYSRVVEKNLTRDFRAPGLDFLPVPQHDKAACSRVMTAIPFRLPHVTLAHEFPVVEQQQGEDPGLDPSDSLYGPAYSEHPLVLEAKAAGVPWQNIRPISFYVDAARYTTRESFVGWFWMDLRSNRKFLCCAIRGALRALGCPPPSDHRSPITPFPGSPHPQAPPLQPPALFCRPENLPPGQQFRPQRNSLPTPRPLNPSHPLESFLREPIRQAPYPQPGSLHTGHTA